VSTDSNFVGTQQWMPSSTVTTTFVFTGGDVQGIPSAANPAYNKVSSPAPRIHPRDARGWLLCEGCSEANEYAEPPADGPFICGECRAVRDG
jgi:hypothetical protein